MEDALHVHLQLRLIAEFLVDAGVEVHPKLLAGECGLESIENLDELNALHVEKLCSQSRALYQVLTEMIKQIEGLGGVVRDVEDGMVDFLTFLDGQSEVFLSWKIGETRISHYRDGVTEWSPRKPLGAHSFVSHRRLQS
jgi:hypothetical protein